MWFMYNTGVKVLTDCYWYVIHVQYRCKGINIIVGMWFMYNTGVKVLTGVKVFIVGMWFMYNTGVKVLTYCYWYVIHVQYRCKGINRLLLVCDSCTIQV